MKKTKETAIPKAEQNWEIKDRTYTLTGNMSPLTYMLKSKAIIEKHFKSNNTIC